MADKERYMAQIALVKEECKDVDEDEVAKEFERYENEFLIPPNDAVRSVILKFQNVEYVPSGVIVNFTNLKIKLGK